ncbi:MAG: hypothetical protein K2X66_03790 [Cyanobacteria bacterium]|nr:hypothetical protein [Cyanobacteriota bacterium]
MVNSVKFGCSSSAMAELRKTSAPRQVKFAGVEETPEKLPPVTDEQTSPGTAASADQRGFFTKVKDGALKALGFSGLTGKAAWGLDIAAAALALFSGGTSLFLTIPSTALRIYRFVQGYRGESQAPAAPPAQPSGTNTVA